MSDTRNDYRFLVAEHAVDVLERIIVGKALPVPINWSTALQLHRQIRAVVKRMRYSFMPPTLLASSEESKQLQDLVKLLAETLFPRQWIEELKKNRKNMLRIAEAKYALRVLYGLPARLARGDENDVYNAVDIECVRVVSTEKHPTIKGLLVTRASGIYVYTIVTNIQDLKRNEIRAAAILPPRAFDTVVSEAMYCSAPLTPGQCTPGKRAPRKLVKVGEIAAIISSITEKYK